MIGPPDIDHLVEAALHLVTVIGDIGREIRPRAVRFPERPIDFVAKGGSPEQCLRARLPVVRQLALWRFQHSGIDEPAVGENPNTIVDCPALGQAAL